MTDAVLSAGATLAAAIHLGYWISGDAAASLLPVLWEVAFAAYAYRVHRVKQRLSRQHVGNLLQALREPA